MKLDYAESCNKIGESKNAIDFRVTEVAINKFAMVFNWLLNWKLKYYNHRWLYMKSFCEYDVMYVSDQKKDSLLLLQLQVKTYEKKV